MFLSAPGPEQLNQQSARAGFALPGPLERVRDELWHAIATHACLRLQIACPNLEEVVADADVLVFCMPHQFVRGIVQQLKGKVRFAQSWAQSACRCTE